MAKDGTTGLYVEEGREFNMGRPRRANASVSAPRSAGADDTKIGPERLAERFARYVECFDAGRRVALADVLRLPPAALDVLPIGWWPDRRWWNPDTNREDGEPGCWTFAEYDSQDRIVGVGLRWPAGHKGQLAGGRRGLILPADWRDLPDPVIVAEGPSDVLAGRAVGLNVIGRPSNSGGSELLAQVCRHRQVIILGENDRRQDGRWPGKDGAEAVARKLEADWCRPVPVAYPPPDRKDLRTWIVGLAPNLGNTDTADLGATIFEALRPPRVQLLVGAPDKRDRVVVSAFRWAEGPDAAPIHSDRLHPDQDSARRRFAKALRQAEPQTDVDQVTQRLMSIGIPRTETPCGLAGDGGRPHDPDASILPAVFLPGGPVSINESASQLGELLGQTERYLLRGGAVVTTAKDDAGHLILDTLKPAALASAFETVASLAAVSKDEGPRPAVCTEQGAKLILHCEAFLQELPTLRLLSACPVLIERDGVLVQVCGYDRESGIMAIGEPTVVISTADAVTLLRGVLSDFRFATQGDQTRALAALITPALIMGQLLRGRAPVDLGEADASQSGKGFRNKITAAIYNHTVSAFTQKKGGVGSMEESFNTALIRGRIFISLDNVRGLIDSPAMESFITEDSYLARAPYLASVDIDPRRVILQLTSNRAEITPDFANRSSCVRILKQPIDYAFPVYPEGDVLDHVRANQPQYPGAVFAVVRAWHEAGKPTTNETRHDFRPWARTLDWIVQHIFDAGALLDGHRETQVRMATPALNWLRDVALAVRDAGQMGLWLRAAQLADILAESSTAEVPGLPDGGDLEDEETRKKVRQAIGRRLGQCFRTGSSHPVDRFLIERREQESLEYRRAIREYRFHGVETGPSPRAYAPQADQGRIGAKGEEAPSEWPGNREGSAGGCSVPPDGAYGAPVPAPIRAPVATPIPPNAPMGHLIARGRDEKPRALEERSIDRDGRGEVVGTTGASGADSAPPVHGSSPPRRNAPSTPRAGVEEDDDELFAEEVSAAAAILGVELSGAGSPESRG
jgi:hypothetical protein